MCIKDVSIGTHEIQWILSSLEDSLGDIAGDFRIFLVMFILLLLSSTQKLIRLIKLVAETAYKTMATTFQMDLNNFCDLLYLVVW